MLEILRTIIGNLLARASDVCPSLTAVRGRDAKGGCYFGRDETTTRSCRSFFALIELSLKGLALAEGRRDGKTKRRTNLRLCAVDFSRVPSRLHSLPRRVFKSNLQSFRP